MEVHKLKTDPDLFQASLEGRKPYEIRKMDRNFAEGDLLVLRETKHSAEEMANGASLEYTGRIITRLVSHMHTGHGMQDGWCLLSVRVVS